MDTVTCINCAKVCARAGYFALRDGTAHCKECFTCGYCALMLDTKYVKKGVLFYHSKCYEIIKANSVTCAKCNSALMPNDLTISLGNERFHKICFACDVCYKEFTNSYISNQGYFYHPWCAACCVCYTDLSRVAYEKMGDGRFMCKPCFVASGQQKTVYGSEENILIATPLETTAPPVPPRNRSLGQQSASSTQNGSIPAPGLLMKTASGSKLAQTSETSLRQSSVRPTVGSRSLNQKTDDDATVLNDNQEATVVSGATTVKLDELKGAAPVYEVPVNTRPVMETGSYKTVKTSTRPMLKTLSKDPADQERLFMAAASSLKAELENFFTNPKPNDGQQEQQGPGDSTLGLQSDARKNSSSPEPLNRS